MSCGVYPSYTPCPLLCQLTTAGGQFYELNGLLSYCLIDNSVDYPVYGNCVKAYLNCQPYESSSSFVGSSSSAGNNDFSYENLKNGFRDYYEYFFMLFVCFILIRLFKEVK